MSEKLPILPVASSSQKPLSFRRTISSPLRATSLLALGGLAALTLTSLATSSRSICSRTSHSGKEDSLGAWIEKQAKISWWSLLDNVGPTAGAKPGLVIASPSRSHPDYFYTWTRDSAITFGTIFDRFQPSNISSNGATLRHADSSLEPLLREFVASQRELQLVKNPSGSFTDGGLGEPKFMVDGTAFKGSWGRPQNDGPPLRAMVMTRYASYLLDRSAPEDETYITSHLYDATKLMSPGSVLKSDLEYVAHNWNKDSFDLWEEISGPHFFTLLVSHRSLAVGAALADRLQDQGAAKFYLAQADLIQKKLDSFWLPSKNYIQASLPSSKFGRSGLDSAVLLAVLKAGDLGEESWGVAGERMLATVEKYVKGFKDLYPLNEGGKRKEWNGALAVGRYTEDVYDGDGKSKANPWFIATFAVSEVAFKILTHLETTSVIRVTDVSLDFWKRFFPSAEAGDVYSRGAIDGVFEDVTKKLELWADGFLTVGKTFEGEGGAFSEQFGRIDGTSKGAKHLTWSYGSFLDAINARKHYHHLRNQHRR
ncbi:Six-hairpin glycosidase-like protein [Mrakia frigida]|uniref:glucan 1,4-alpha-glucosidase n=1 Tax=Mrakia frigida TaxID=29902 RepID=UPI003FCBF369